MREILFRGKAINRDKGYFRTNYKNGDWVYGLVTRLFDKRFENLPAEMANTDGINGIEIDYNTIGQFTGLTDKTGKKIFEGDIVKNDYGYIGQIVFKACSYYIEWKSGNFTIDLYVMANSLEVIGNIHDKPELLEGTE